MTKSQNKSNKIKIIEYKRESEYKEYRYDQANGQM